MPQSAVRFRAGQIAVLFIALAAIASIPILLYPWPPLSDYINHLARMHVIATIGSDPDLERCRGADLDVAAGRPRARPRRLAVAVHRRRHARDAARHRDVFLSHRQT